MLNEEIVAMSVSEYVDLLIAISEMNGHNNSQGHPQGPHKTNWDYCHWHGVVGIERYSEAIPLLVERGYESWMED
jgi:hypothetical protein